MNYPQYTNIIQICFLPDNEMEMPNEMFDSVNNNHGVINKTVLLNESEWEKIMDCYISQCITNQQIPILHLDMHGCCYGFCKDQKDIIGWSRLINKIRELNQSCNGQLFLSLNVCEGLLLNVYNRLDGYSPLSLKTIGSYNKVNVNDGRLRFTAMYNEYFKSKDMDESISAFFHQNTPRQEGHFVLV